MKQFSRISRRILVLVLLASLAASPAVSEGVFRPLPLDLSGGAPYSETFASAKTVYEDPTIRVERLPEARDSVYGEAYYAVDIRIKDPSQIRTASADPADFLSDRRIQAEVMAGRVNAVFAMNGDYCGDYQGGTSIKYVLRQGTVFRDTVDTSLDMLLIDENGDFHIIPGGPELVDLDKTQVDGKKVFNALQFGPGLVVDGNKTDEAYILDDAHSPLYADPAGRAVRVCIIQVEPLHYMAICTKYAVNLAHLQQIVTEAAPGCANAYVLDGGGSAQLVYLGKTTNFVRGAGSQSLRKISDILYFASAWLREGE